MDAYRDTSLTGAGLRNGRIYLSASETPFFKPASLGDRAGREPVTPIDIEVHGEVATTDIRRSSGTRIGPRKSFAKWFRAIRAQEGATLRLTRLDKRYFQLDYLG